MLDSLINDIAEAGVPMINGQKGVQRAIHNKMVGVSFKTYEDAKIKIIKDNDIKVFSDNIIDQSIFVSVQAIYDFICAVSSMTNECPLLGFLFRRSIKINGNKVEHGLPAFLLPIDKMLDEQSLIHVNDIVEDMITGEQTILTYPANDK